MMKLYRSSILLINAFLIHCSFGQGSQVGSLSTLAHEVSGDVIFLTPTTFQLNNFNYDGQGPDTFLYYFPLEVTASPSSTDGVIIPLSDTTDSEGKFGSGRLVNAPITVDMPQGMTLCDIGTLTVWCRQALVFFATLEIPSSAYSIGEGGECTILGTDSYSTSDNYENCEFLDQSLQLFWSVRTQYIDIKICGCIPTNRVNQYMAFGVSRSTDRTDMLGSDCTVAWMNTDDGTANAVDYLLQARSPCVEGSGVCPDEISIEESCTNDVYNVSGFLSGQQQCVRYTRMVAANDVCDLSFNIQSPQFIVWAIGGIDETAFRHFITATATEAAMNLGRNATDNCQAQALVCETCAPFESQQLWDSDGTLFNFRIGPSGGERGYMAITEQAGWGIAWYVNETLIPELNLKRGVTYTFVVEGGNDPSDLANYHPMYITSSSNGAILRTTEPDEEEVVYAGIVDDEPTGVGRLCELTETEESISVYSSCESVTDYQESLETNCDDGASGAITWTPDEDTPDVVYYQCATHLNLGWKIVLSAGALRLSFYNILFLIVLLPLVLL